MESKKKGCIDIKFKTYFNEDNFWKITHWSVIIIICIVVFYTLWEEVSLLFALVGISVPIILAIISLYLFKDRLWK